MRRCIRWGLVIALLVAFWNWQQVRDGLYSASVDDLITVLEGEDPEQRYLAARQIAKLGPAGAPAVPALVRRLNDEDPDVRAAAARALGAIGPAAREQSLPALMKAFGDPGVTSKQQPVWFEAGSAVGKLGPEVLPQVMPQLDDDEIEKVAAASAALHNLGAAGKQAVPKLITMLDDSEQMRVRSAIYALIGIGPAASAAVPRLVQLLEHEDFHTQYWACRGLGGIGSAAAPAVPPLIACLEGGTASVRRNAAKALGQIGPVGGQQTVDALVEVVQSDDRATVREAAVLALGEIGPGAKSAVPALEAALKDPTFSARPHAAHALWQLNGDAEPILPLLLTELRQGNEPWVAADALGEMGRDAKPALPELIEMLESDHLYTRIYTAQALGRMGPLAEDSLRELKQLRRDPEQEVREEADVAIRRIQGQIIEDEQSLDE